VKGFTTPGKEKVSMGHRAAKKLTGGPSTPNVAGPGWDGRGPWREHGWIATGGDWVYEAPGESYTLVAG
jgi:hypothetical protein